MEYGLAITKTTKRHLTPYSKHNNKHYAECSVAMQHQKQL
jgi:hypothetical protein